jgi:hypothetical protein
MRHHSGRQASAVDPRIGAIALPAIRLLGYFALKQRRLSCSSEKCRITVASAGFAFSCHRSSMTTNASADPGA